jgi:hypothetical protein
MADPKGWRVLPLDHVITLSAEPEEGMELALTDGTGLRILSVDGEKSELVVTVLKNPVVPATLVSVIE